MIRSPRRPSPPSRINRILIPSIFVCGFTFVLSTVFCLFLLPARQRSDIQIHTTFSPYKEDPTFPVHVNEWEEINHPGMEAMGKIVRVKVPQFFTHPALPSMNATTEAPPLLTRKQALAIGTRYNGQLETIFLSIASYRDPECRNTLADAFRYAKYPERVRVAIVDQIVQGDIDCVTPASYCDESTSATSEDPLCRYRKNIDYFKLEASLAVGPVFARHLAHRMYRGEYFAMQIDAHVRFTKEWDDDIITQWKYTENEMAVLSTYVSEINKHLNLETRERILGVRPIMCNTKYTSPGHPLHHLTHGVQPEMNPRDGNVPIMHPFWAAGFSFARGHFVLQVPYDQYLPMVFQGEEISMGIRGFTYGYDFYAPARNVIYHMYASEHPERKTVKKFWGKSNVHVFFLFFRSNNHS